MKAIKNMSIATKLWSGALVFSLAIGVVAYTGLTGTSRLSSTVGNMTKLQVPQLQRLMLASNEARQARTRQYRLLVAPDAKKQAKLLKDIEGNIQGATDKLAEFDKFASTKEEKATADMLQSLWANYSEYNKQIPGILSTTGNKGLTELLEKTSRETFVEKFIPEIEKAGELKVKEALAAEETRKGIESDTKTKIALLGLFSIVAGLTIFGFIVSGIRHSVKVLTKGLTFIREHHIQPLTNALARFAKADLTYAIACESTPIEIDGKDELAKVIHDLDNVQSEFLDAINGYEEARVSLNSLIGVVRNGANNVASYSGDVAKNTEQVGLASTDIARGSTTLAGRAEEASDAMEKFAQVIDQITVQTEVQANAIGTAAMNLNEATEILKEVASASDQMNEAALAGSEAVSVTINAMEKIQSEVTLSAERISELDAKGQQIGQIVSTIEEIASQTNLLALNAAIEAARAGEHGRGFAVVATEVRKLAEKSGDATREISDLIESIRKSVDEAVKAILETKNQVVDGTAQSKSAGSSLNSILESSATVEERLKALRGASRNVETAMKDADKATTETVELKESLIGESKVVGGAIMEVTTVSQDTAAASEELSASTDEVSRVAANLQALSEELLSSISEFKTVSGQEAPLRLAA